MARALFYLFYLLHNVPLLTQCQSLPAPSLAVGSNLNALPIIASDFKVQRRTGATLNAPLAQIFHLLYGVIYDIWSTPTFGPERPNIYLYDVDYRWAFDFRRYARFGTEFCNSKITAWTAGRILEGDIGAMQLDQETWSTPKNGYSVYSAPAPAIGHVSLIFLTE